MNKLAKSELVVRSLKKIKKLKLQFLQTLKFPKIIRFRKYLKYGLSISVVIFALAFLGYYARRFLGPYKHYNNDLPRSTESLLTITPPQVTLSPSRNLNNNLNTLINCVDVRDVVVHENIAYLGCMGGVLAINSDTGEIIDELNSLDGLNSNSVTSLALHENKLYIGSQSGINVYDLDSQKMFSLTSKNGLPSDFNIELAYDPPFIWIGTFKGLARLNLETSELSTYTSELQVDNPNSGIGDILVTPDSVYIYFTAHAYSRGYITRYDKDKQTWVSWSPDTFDKKDRLYSITLEYAKRQVYALEANQTWVAIDSATANWQATTSIHELIEKRSAQDCTAGSLTSSNDKLYIKKCDELYIYDASTGAISGFIQNLPSSKYSPVISDGYLWVFSNDASQPWFNKYSLETGATTSHASSRPMEFYKLLTVINDSIAIISTNEGIAKFDIFSQPFAFDEIISTYNLDEYSPSGFIPINDTNESIIYKQICGMGCSEPEFWLYNYESGAAEKLQLDSQIKDLLTNNLTYSSFNYIGTDDNNYLVFKTNINDDYFAYDVPNKRWVTEGIGQAVPVFEKVECGILADHSTEQGFSNLKCGDASPGIFEVISSLKVDSGYVGTYKWGGLFVMRGDEKE